MGSLKVMRGSHHRIESQVGHRDFCSDHLASSSAVSYGPSCFRVTLLGSRSLFWSLSISIIGGPARLGGQFQCGVGVS